MIQAYYSTQDLANETSGIFYLWLTPNSSNQVINFTYERKIQIMVNSTDTLDVPDWAIEAINYNLAVRLIPKFGCSEKRAALLRAEAKTMMKDVLAFDAAVYPIKLKMSKYG